MKHTNTRRLRGTLGSLALLAALPLLLVACSGQSDTDTAPRADAGTGAKWGACMRDAGFDVQDPDDASVRAGLSQAPSGADQDAFAKAAASCAQRAGVEPADSADTQKWEREYAQVASCVRDDYSDFPEQEPGGFTVDDSYPHAEEPAFKQTVADCMQEFSPDTQTQSVG